ncbi:MAG: VF530 family protein [Bacteroidota bacterium]
MSQLNNPLHGITLENLLKELVEYFGWAKLGTYVRINCFISDPNIKSSLTFLRKTPWARKKVEDLYLSMLLEKKRKAGKESPASQ